MLELVDARKEALVPIVLLAQCAERVRLGIEHWVAEAVVVAGRELVALGVEGVARASRFVDGLRAHLAQVKLLFCLRLVFGTLSRR